MEGGSLSSGLAEFLPRARSRPPARALCHGAVEAKQKGVKLAAHYSKFVDLISEFSRTYPRLAKLGGGAAVGSASLHKMADQLDVTIGETWCVGEGRSVQSAWRPGRELWGVPRQRVLRKGARGGACFMLLLFARGWLSESDARAGIAFCKAVAQVCIRLLEDGASFSSGEALGSLGVSTQKQTHKIAKPSPRSCSWVAPGSKAGCLMGSIACSHNDQRRLRPAQRRGACQLARDGGRSADGEQRAQSRGEPRS